MEDRLLAFGSELEYGSAAATMRAGGGSRPIQVSLLVEDQACLGELPIRAVVEMRTEAVEDRLLPLGSELEYDADLPGPAEKGRPILVSVLVEGQPCCGTHPVGAVTVRTETVQHTLGLGRRRTQ